MGYIFDDWKKVLESFQNSVSKELEEIHKCKNDVQQIKVDIFNRLEQGKYLRDDHRLVLSAPEIVIGNVDSSGDLLGGSGSVTIRGEAVNIEGVGDTGSVSTRASSIRQIAVDPGNDGLEAVVYPHSQVVTQARSISLQSNDATDCFPMNAASGGNGIWIHADQSLVVEAAQTADSKKQQIEDKVKDLNARKSALESESKQHKKSIDDMFKKLQTIMDKQNGLADDEELARSNYVDLEDLNQQVNDLLPLLYRSSVDFIHTVSALAEVNRQVKALNKAKGDIKTGDAFAKAATGASLSLLAESIDVRTIDGEGNIHENDGAGISVTTPYMGISMQDKDGKLIKNGGFSVASENIRLSTSNNNASGANATMPAEGSFMLVSKDITVAAIDRELKDKKVSEKALTASGKISLRAETLQVDTNDTEGKGKGTVSINSKAVSVRSMDVDKEKRTDKSLTQGSTMLLLSEKMFVGAKDKSNKSKKVQAVSEEVGLFADKTMEAQQGDGKATLQLSGGNVAVGGSKTDVYGKTTINAATEVKAELKAPKATIDNVEAKSSFKSPNISDGIAVPAPPSTSNLSTKLKAEDAPK